MRNLQKLFRKKNIAIVTCYDATFASFLALAGCDALLVGDSLGMVLYGMKSTREVKLETMIAHGKAVKKSVKKSLSMHVQGVTYHPHRKGTRHRKPWFPVRNQPDLKTKECPNEAQHVPQPTRYLPK